MQAFEHVIGYRFRDPRLMRVALTHPSMAGEADVEHNQRLEFLGDAVLQLIMSERLYREFPKLMEGSLSRLRARSVQERALYNAACSMNLGGYLRLAHGEDRSGGRNRPSILADAMEAVIGAIYLDGGLDEARRIVEYFLPIAPEQVERDHKSELQERIQRDGGDPPVYRIVNETGPPHNRKFFAEVVLADQTIGHGHGSSKKSAEQEAAKAALSQFEVRRCDR